MTWTSLAMLMLAVLILSLPVCRYATHRAEVYMDSRGETQIRCVRKELA